MEAVESVLSDYINVAGVWVSEEAFWIEDSARQGIDVLERPRSSSCRVWLCPLKCVMSLGSEDAVAVAGRYVFHIVLDDVPVLSQLAVLQPVNVANLVDLEEDVGHVVFAV